MFRGVTEDGILLSSRGRLGWMGHWAAWASRRYPCLWQKGWNQMVLKVFSNPNHSGSMILRSLLLGAAWQQYYMDVKLEHGQRQLRSLLCCGRMQTHRWDYKLLRNGLNIEPAGNEGWWRDQGSSGCTFMLSKVSETNLHSFRPMPNPKVSSS